MQVQQACTVLRSWLQLLLLDLEHLHVQYVHIAAKLASGTFLNMRRFNKLKLNEDRQCEKDTNHMKKSTCLAFALRLVPDPAYLCQLIVTFLDNLHPRIWMTGLETNPPNVFQYQLDQYAMCIERSFQPTSTHKGCLIIPEKRGTYSTFTQNAYIWY